MPCHGSESDLHEILKRKQSHKHRAMRGGSDQDGSSFKTGGADTQQTATVRFFPKNEMEIIACYF